MTQFFEFNKDLIAHNLKLFLDLQVELFSF